MSFVAIKNVGKVYQPDGIDSAVRVLADINLEVQVGEFISLICHSCCGKSTLLSIVGGLLPADRGTITLDGVTVVDAGRLVS